MEVSVSNENKHLKRLLALAAKGDDDAKALTTFINAGIFYIFNEKRMKHRFTYEHFRDGNETGNVFYLDDRRPFTVSLSGDQLKVRFCWRGIEKVEQFNSITQLLGVSP